jgi:hypothetical protein
MNYTRVGTWLICCLVFLSKHASGYFATTTTVLLSQAKGVVPNANGPVKATVSAGGVLTIDFSVVAGAGYTAGAVRATTDIKGRVVRIVKQRQACAITYNAAGSIGSVKCTGARQLRYDADAEPAAVNDDAASADDIDNDQDAERTSEENGNWNRKSELVARRDLDSLPCASCASVVYATFNSRIKSICGSSFSRRIPLQYRWPKAVVTALCGMTTRLGDHIDLAYRTCRCCIENSDCPSGVCSAGICLPRKLQRGEPCPDFEDGDCENSRCALDSYPTGKRVCCPSDEYIPHPDTVTLDYYCSLTQAVGASCSRGEMCKSNTCALGSYPSGTLVCCAEGKVFSATYNAFYCTKIQQTGDPCDRNSLCVGVCSAGVCLPGLMPGQPCPDRERSDCRSGDCARGSYPSGEYVCCPSYETFRDSGTKESYCYGAMGAGTQCAFDAQCSSGVCSEGVCLTRPLGIGQPCPDQDHSDCAGGVCARSSFPSGAYVCCPRNASFSRYCVQGTGGLCGFNSMCVSEQCSGGVCLGEKLGSGMLCSADEECESGSCALGAHSYGDFICCDNTYTSRHGLSFCTNQEAGSPCRENEFCLSYVCSDRICLPGPLSAGEPCPDDDDRDCENYACGMDSYPFGSYICCPSNGNIYDDSLQDYYCTGQGVGSSCNSNELCSSGVCSGGICMAQKVSAGQRCPDGEDHDCQNGVCARGSYPDGDYVCCPSGRQVYDVSDFYCTGR